ncbi:LPP20 family lipoprotein [Shewanella sp. 2_MG-2023]|nr:LPP20 family lipoprotein [Shewanella sp. 7_MG-2023]MDO6770863.1 LPP20 family lipoprotein [Shewanella sp. 2_MG-2023]
MMNKFIFIIGLITFLCACNSTAQTESMPLDSNDSIPSWVLMPTSETGLASSSCVLWGGNMSAARGQAIANARADLATQIQIRAKVMDQTKNSQIQQGLEVQTQSSFYGVSNQVAEQSLTGAKTKEIAFARLDNQKQLCALVEMENTEALFEKLLTAAGATIDPSSREAMYIDFRTTEITKELQMQLDSMN